MDRQFRQQEQLSEFAAMDDFQGQALRMLLSDHVRNAFDLSQESNQTKD